MLLLSDLADTILFKLFEKMHYLTESRIIKVFMKLVRETEVKFKESVDLFR